MVYREARSGVRVAVSARLFRGDGAGDEDAVAVAELGGRGALETPVDEGDLGTGSGLLLGVFDGTAPAVSGWAARRLLQLVGAPLSPVSAVSIRGRLVAAMEETARGAFAAIRAGTLRGTGTTATVAVVVGATLVLAHVGDSRAYVWRRGMLTQVSRDHTLRRSVLDGEIPGIERAELLLELQGNVLMQAIGPRDRVTPFVETIELRLGDVLVLCTGGVHRWLEEGVIGALIAARPGAAGPCDGIREAAIRASGGVCSAGLVVASFDDAALVPPADADELPDWSDRALRAEGP